MKSTWKPHEKHGKLTTQSDLPDSVFAFPKKRKEPLTDARHVRNAIARMDQVTGVASTERDLAWANIKKAARHYDVAVSESSWREMGSHPQPAKTKRRTATKRAPAKRTKTKSRSR